MLTALPLGVGDAFSNRFYSSCVALEAGGQWLLFDCPHPIRKMLREGGEKAGVAIDVGDVLGVIVSHLHADHCSGLEGIGYYSRFLLGRKMTLAIHPDVLEHLWDGHLRAGMEHLKSAPDGPAMKLGLEDYFDVKPLHFERPLDLGPFRIESRPTIHHIPTTAVKVHAGGRTLGLSADTAFDPGLVAWLAEADLFFHETNHGIHTPYEKLAALPAEVRSKMRLIHYPDDFDAAGSIIECLVEGRRYKV